MCPSRPPPQFLICIFIQFQDGAMLCVLGHMEDHLGEGALHEKESFLSYPSSPTFMNNPWEPEKTSH